MSVLERGPRMFFAAWLALACTASTGLAQDPVVGESAAALPAVLSVGVPEIGSTRVAVAASGGYGYLEAMRDANASRGRLGGLLAVGARVVPWLSFAVDSSLQHDTRGGQLERPVDAVSVQRLALRASTRVRGGGRLGLELAGIAKSGTDASPAFDATSLEARGLLAFAVGAHTTLAGNVGMRLDRSAKAVSAASALTPAQRIAAGLSDFDALLIGLGVDHQVGMTELLAELHADVLVGSRSALLGKAPMGARAGARYHAGPSVQVELSVGASPSARPPLRPGDPLVAIEPRVDVAFGVRVAWPGSSDDAQRGAEEASPPPSPPPAPAKTAAARVPAAPVPEASAPIAETAVAEPGLVAAPAATAAAGESEPESAGPAQNLAQIRGNVRAFSGEPLQASITVYPRGLKASTDEHGYFQLDVPPGKYSVRLRAYGYQSQSRRVQSDADGVTVLNVELRKK